MTLFPVNRASVVRQSQKDRRRDCSFVWLRVSCLFLSCRRCRCCLDETRHVIVVVVLFGGGWVVMTASRRKRSRIRRRRSCDKKLQGRRNMPYPKILVLGGYYQHDNEDTTTTTTTTHRILPNSHIAPHKRNKTIHAARGQMIWNP